MKRARDATEDSWSWLYPQDYINEDRVTYSAYDFELYPSSILAPPRSADNTFFQGPECGQGYENYYEDVALQPVYDCDFSTTSTSSATSSLEQEDTVSDKEPTLKTSERAMIKPGFGCTWCNKKYSCRGKLKWHMLRAHLEKKAEILAMLPDKSTAQGKQFVCSIRSCGRGYSTLGNLNKHYRLAHKDDDN